MGNVFEGRVWCQPPYVLGIAILCLQVEFAWCQPQYVLGIAILCLQVGFGVNLSMF